MKSLIKSIYLWFLCGLFGCTYKSVIATDGYLTMIITGDGKVLQSGATLLGPQGSFRIVLASKGTELEPRIYIQGAAHISEVVADNVTTRMLSTNNQYKFIYKFKRPGEAIVLVTWENNQHYVKPFLLNLRYYGQP